MTENSMRLPWTEDQISDRLRMAVQVFWSMRERQQTRQREVGSMDTGDRGTVTGGKHMDSFVDILSEVAFAAGFGQDEIKTRGGLELAGFFRPAKRWDLVIVRNGRLCAAIELKSMAGSYGNNLNNRAEEGVGSAVDLWKAYRQGLLGLQQPFVGYFFLVRDEERSNRAGRDPRPFLRLDEDFSGSSYVTRVGILCQRLVLERIYTSAAFIASLKGSSGEYREPVPALSFSKFVKSLFGHLVGCE